MRHIKNYESFNESLIDIFRSKDRINYNNAVRLIFDRIKEIFDYDNLSCVSELSGVTCGNKFDNITYRLEETDSELGYIDLNVHEYISPMGAKIFNKSYVLKIDDNIVECSNSLKREIYFYLKKKFKEKERIDKESKSLTFKNKYNI